MAGKLHARNWPLIALVLVSIVALGYSRGSRIPPGNGEEEGKQGADSLPCTECDGTLLRQADGSYVCDLNSAHRLSAQQAAGHQ